MTDTTREAFEVWHDGIYSGPQQEIAFAAWQAATERATQVERERCAKVCEAIKTVCGTDDVERGWNGAMRRAAAAIRQGGDTP